MLVIYMNKEASMWHIKHMTKSEIQQSEEKDECIN
jgi:hypothetical protein